MRFLLNHNIRILKQFYMICIAVIWFFVIPIFTSAIYYLNCTFIHYSKACIDFNFYNNPVRFKLCARLFSSTYMYVIFVIFFKCFICIPLFRPIYKLFYLIIKWNLYSWYSGYINKRLWKLNGNWLIPLRCLQSTYCLFISCSKHSYLRIILNIFYTYISDGCRVYCFIKGGKLAEKHFS